LAIAFLLASLAGPLLSVGLASTGRAPAQPASFTVTRRAGAGVALLAIATLTLASCDGSAGNIQALLAQAARAGQLAPSIPGSSIDDARLQSAAANPPLCIADYTEALRDFPDLIKALAGRAGCYVNGGGNGPAAVHDYSQAISLSPNASALYLRRAAADRVAGDTDAAVADYQHAADIPSASSDQLQIAVDGLLILRQYDAAQTTYRRAVTLDPIASLLHLAGADIAIATDDDGLARQEFAEAERLANTGAERAKVLAHECHAEVLRQEYVNATTDCASAARLSSFSSAAYDDLAAADLAMGNLTTALSDLDASIGAYLGN